MHSTWTSYAITRVRKSETNSTGKDGGRSARKELDRRGLGHSHNNNTREQLLFIVLLGIDKDENIKD